MKEFDQSTAQIEEISKGHPRQLYILFFAEMWERFSFYGMKALLMAYMVTQLEFDEPHAYAILGSYAALVYTMPLFGGMMADRIVLDYNNMMAPALGGRGITEAVLQEYQPRFRALHARSMQCYVAQSGLLLISILMLPWSSSVSTSKAADSRTPDSVPR